MEELVTKGVNYQLKENSFSRDENLGLDIYVDSILNEYIEVYQSTKDPIQVNFRNIISWVPYSESYTHYIHQYPAKLLKHIPIFFLNSKILNKNSGGVVLDPFCGSGTVLLESILNGFNAVGCDANPLARLIAEVKTTPIDCNKLRPYVDSIVKQAKKYRKYDKKNVVNVDHWFPLGTQIKLSKIHRAIKAVEDDEVKRFLLVTFSNIVKKTSFADPNLSVPVKIKPNKYNNEQIREKLFERINQVQSADVYEIFRDQLIKNISRVESLTESQIKHKAKVVSSDARVITKSLESNDLYASDSVDFILTSPPYSGAQKYIRSSSLNLGWLDFCENNPLRFYEKRNIGREHYSKKEYVEPLALGIKEIDGILEKIWNINPLRAHINGNYLLEMELAIKEMYRVLKYGCYCVIVIGNNEVCGMAFETHKYLTAIAERNGFTLELVLVDDIHSRGLMTKRNKTASIINSEWILVLKK